MEKLKSKNWWEAAVIRAIRTFCQTFASLIGVGAALEDINWLRIISVSLTATILSLATSIATNLPEVDTKASEPPVQEDLPTSPAITSEDLIEEETKS